MIPKETGKEGSETSQGTHLSFLVLPLSMFSCSGTSSANLLLSTLPLPPCLGICALGPSLSMSQEHACQPHNCRC